MRFYWKFNLDGAAIRLFSLEENRALLVSEQSEKALFGQVGRPPLEVPARLILGEEVVVGEGLVDHGKEFFLIITGLLKSVRQVGKVVRVPARDRNVEGLGGAGRRGKGRAGGTLPFFFGLIHAFRKGAKI